MLRTFVLGEAGMWKVKELIRWTIVWNGRPELFENYVGESRGAAFDEIKRVARQLWEQGEKLDTFEVRAYDNGQIFVFDAKHPPRGAKKRWKPGDGVPRRAITHVEIDPDMLSLVLE